MEPLPSDPLFGLTRSAQDRVLTGLVGGISQRTGLPALPIRIGLVPLAIVFAGIPVLIYLAGAAAIRGEQAEESHLERWLRPGSKAAFPLTVAIGVTLAALVSEGGFDGLVQSATALAMIGGGLYLATGQHEKSAEVKKRRDRVSPAELDGTSNDPNPLHPLRDVSDATTLAEVAVPTLLPTSTAQPATTPVASGRSDLSPPPPPRPRSSESESEKSDPPPPRPADRPLAYAVTAPTPDRPPRQRSVAGPLVLGLTVLVVAAGLAVNLAGASIATPALIGSLALVVIGLGLVTTAFRGRAPGLVPLGLLVLAVTYGIHVADSRTIQLGERSIAPVAISDDVTYEHFAGAIVVDLRETMFAETTAPQEVTVDVAFGEILVRLPEGIDAEISAFVGAGEIEIGDTMMEGTDLTHLVPAEDEEPDLVVVLNAAVGRIEVQP